MQHDLGTAHDEDLKSLNSRAHEDFEKIADSGVNYPCIIVSSEVFARLASYSTVNVDLASSCAVPRSCCIFWLHPFDCQISDSDQKWCQKRRDDCYYSNQREQIAADNAQIHSNFYYDD